MILIAIIIVAVIIIIIIIIITGADPGFFLGGGALVSCFTSTPINHIVFFFCRIPVVLENRRSSQGAGVRTPCTLPLDPPLHHHHHHNFSHHH